MEISARVLKEVEFNSSLRGYNTDEVDEFLEQVAVAVERLQTEARAAAERADDAERTARDNPAVEGDDAIKRTLVLAQRTADMAIKEAQEEATEVLDRARGEAQTLVDDARDSALRITSDAERRLRDEVARLTVSRDELMTEVETLVALLGSERVRLAESLSTALRYVEQSLTASDDLHAAHAASQASAARSGSGYPYEAPAGAQAEPTDMEPTPEAAALVDDADADAGADAADAADAGAIGDVDEVDEVEAGIAADAAAAAPTPSRRTEPEQYDWDSVIRGRSESAFADRSSRMERPTLTALPSRSSDALQDTAAWRMRSPGSDRPA